jgi:AmmeMemoRadiSam system protein B
VPHAALPYSGLAAARSFQAIDQKKVKRVIILGAVHPSLHYDLPGAALSLRSDFATPIGNLALDQPAIRQLLKNPLFRIDDQVHREEHSVEMQLPFIRYKLGEVPIVPVLLGSFKNERELTTIAKSLKEILRDGDLLVLSGDMTHYGQVYDYEPAGAGDMKARVRNLDQRAFQFVKSVDAHGLWLFREETGENMCSFLPLYVYVTLLTQAKEQITIADYSTSQDSGAGVKSFESRRCVGYLSLIFSANGQSK